jgi:two-component system, OmpR family, sensor histidine kinase MprB
VSPAGPKLSLTARLAARASAPRQRPPRSAAAHRFVAPTAWWRRRTLHARLSLLVTGAVAFAVVLLAAIAFLAVREIQHRQIESQLTTDAQAIAAAPDQWHRVTPLPSIGRDGDDGHGDDGHRPHDFGPRWQILDRSGSPVSQSTSAIPVTSGAREVATGQQRRLQEEVRIGGRDYLVLTVPAAGGGAVQVAVDEEPANRTLATVGLLLIAASALGVAGAAFLGRTVARAGLVPVDQLTRAVERVAVTMDLTEPVPVRGADEIARLGRSVNTMLAAIDSSRRAQRTLVEDAGHEMRTPLTSIRTNIELLLAVERQPDLAHRLPPEERAKLLRDLEAQVSELATLTTELVELAREETTREQPEPVELSDVVSAAVDRVRMRAPTVTFTADLAPATVLGRTGELERMIVNVLDNAAKWSPPDTTVETRLTVTDTHCRLTISDSGPGIDKADRPYVFDRFYRAPAARAMPGSGLGLAIVAQTAQQHGGSVAVQPRTPTGTTVVIQLPRLPFSPIS